MSEASGRNLNMECAPILMAGSWQAGTVSDVFQAENPALGTVLPAKYPVSSRAEVLRMLQAGSEAAEALHAMSGARLSEFLEAYAEGILKNAEALVEMAHAETALPKKERLAAVELPRTVDQLRQAARATREESWRQPVRDEARQIYSHLAPLGGPVVTMGPNNFPFAYNSVAGGDFAAAIAAHNPVIAKAHPGHPGTTRLLAEIAFAAVTATGLPPATVQMLYQVPVEAGYELVSHPLTGATGFTGSKAAGMKLKAAADRAGKLIYLEMSSVNPVVLLGGALRERGDAVAEEFFISCTMATGQFCTNPGFILVPESAAGKKFIADAVARFEAAAPGILLGRSVLKNLEASVAQWQQHGATLLCGGQPMTGPAYRFANTLLQVSAERFLKSPADLQMEAFGPAALFVIYRDTTELATVIRQLEGNLTGSIYSDTTGKDDAEYAVIEPPLRQRVGRLLNDRMPTGVTVSPAMNHGGPYPATGHAGFTAVGFPGSIRRFAMLQCFDHVREGRIKKFE